MSTDVCNLCAVYKSSWQVGDNWKPFSFGYHFSLPTFATSPEVSPTSRNLALKLIHPHIVADHVRSCSLSNCPLTHAPCLPHKFIVVSSANLHCQHPNSGEKYHGKCLASTCRLMMVTVCPQMGQSFLPTFDVLRGFLSATDPFIHTVLVSPALSWHPEELASMSPALSRVHSVPGVKVTILLGGGDGEWTEPSSQCCQSLVSSKMSAELGIMAVLHNFFFQLLRHHQQLGHFVLLLPLIMQHTLNQPQLLWILWCLSRIKPPQNWF